MRDYIYKRVIPPKRRTSLTWGRPVLKLESWTLTTKLFLKLTLHLPSNSIRRALENTALQLEGTVQCDLTGQAENGTGAILCRIVLSMRLYWERCFSHWLFRSRPGNCWFKIHALDSSMVQFDTTSIQIGVSLYGITVD